MNDLGARFLNTLTDPDVIGIYTLVVAEGVFMKEIAKQFWGVGPGRILPLLARYFEHQTRLGVLQLEYPDQAAQQFWGLLLGDYQYQCVLCLRDRPSEDEVALFVRTAVACFLDGCRTRAGVSGEHRMNRRLPPDGKSQSARGKARQLQASR